MKLFVSDGDMTKYYKRALVHNDKFELDGCIMVDFETAKTLEIDMNYREEAIMVIKAIKKESFSSLKVEWGKLINEEVDANDR